MLLGHGQSGTAIGQPVLPGVPTANPYYMGPGMFSPKEQRANSSLGAATVHRKSTSPLLPVSPPPAGMFYDSCGSASHGSGPASASLPKEPDSGRTCRGLGRKTSVSGAVAAQASKRQYGRAGEDYVKGATALVESPAAFAATMRRLRGDNAEERQCVVEALVPIAVQLALRSEDYSRLVQQLVAVAGSERHRLIAAIAPHTHKLYDSQHGNYVLTKLIEVVPASCLRPIVAQLEGRATATARHRFGCRVLERLIDHCSREQLHAIEVEIVMDAEPLCRHPFGNFVVQRLFERGPPEVRLGMLQKMLPGLPLLAMHRTASHLVQAALEHYDSGRPAILEALFGLAPEVLAEVACSRYGSFVIEQLLGVLAEGALAEVRLRLGACIEDLAASEYGRRVAETFELTTRVQESGAEVQPAQFQSEPGDAGLIFDTLICCENLREESFSP